MKLDEELLKKFELNDPRLDALRKGNEKLYLELLQHDGPPSKPIMAGAAKRLLSDFEVLAEVSLVVGKELDRWLARIESQKGRVGTGPGPLEQDELASYQKEVELSKQLQEGYRLSHSAAWVRVVRTRKSSWTGSNRLTPTRHGPSFARGSWVENSAPE